MRVQLVTSGGRCCGGACDGCRRSGVLVLLFFYVFARTSSFGLLGTEGGGGRLTV